MISKRFRFIIYCTRPQPFKAHFPIEHCFVNIEPLIEKSNY